jgi:hypothetical protein
MINGNVIGDICCRLPEIRIRRGSSASAGGAHPQNGGGRTMNSLTGAASGARSWLDGRLGLGGRRDFGDGGNGESGSGCGAEAPEGHYHPLQHYPLRRLMLKREG